MNKLIYLIIQMYTTFVNNTNLDYDELILTNDI